MTTSTAAEVVLDIVHNDKVTEGMFEECASLFSNNYGIWGPTAEALCGLKYGSRIKMSANKLKSQIFPAGASNTLVRAKIDNVLVGHVFGTRWEYDGHNIIWITQLCLAASQRGKGISKLLIEQLRSGERIMGILSSHPYAIMAVLRVSGCEFEQVDLQMAKDHGHAIMKSCPVPYVHNAVLRGSLFEENAPQGVVSCAHTSFFVDHTEPLHALQTLEIAGIIWPFGTLPDGHEFALIIEPNS